jgi:GPH family glycoside/pentoside/hexuronide:cation symporter
MDRNGNNMNQPSALDTTANDRKRYPTGHLNFRDSVLFALGAPGWQITATIMVSIGIYYYLPPEGSGLEVQVSEEIFFGVLTAYGLARLIGGVIDSLADPVVGHYSDRSVSRFGRRKIFLVMGIVPMVITPALLFFPPGEPGSQDVFVYLTVMLSLYYIFFTVYVAPYNALIPEIAKTEAERVELSRLKSVVGGCIAMTYGILWLAGIKFFKELGMDANQAVQTVVVISCVISFVFCVCPILVIKEHELSYKPSSMNMKTALATTLRNRPFLTYLFAQVFFFMGITMSGPAIPYFARVILGRDEGFAAILSLTMLPGILLGFYLIQKVVDRIGTKNTLVISVLFLGLAHIPYGFLTPSAPGDAHDMFNLVTVFSLSAFKGLGIAGMMILPTVILGQLIDLDEARTGAGRSAMYYGVQGLMTKWVYAASAAIMSYLLSAYGRSAAEPLGVLLIGPFAGVLCLLSAALYTLYPEKQIRSEANEVLREASTDATRPG